MERTGRTRSPNKKNGNQDESDDFSLMNTHSSPPSQRGKEKKEGNKRRKKKIDFGVEEDKDDDEVTYLTQIGPTPQYVLDLSGFMESGKEKKEKKNDLFDNVVKISRKQKKVKRKDKNQHALEEVSQKIEQLGFWLEENTQFNTPQLAEPLGGAKRMDLQEAIRIVRQKAKKSRLEEERAKHETQLKSETQIDSILEVRDACTAPDAFMNHKVPKLENLQEVRVEIKAEEDTFFQETSFIQLLVIEVINGTVTEIDKERQQIVNFLLSSFFSSFFDILNTKRL